MERAKEKYRFPLFTWWFEYLLMYKLAYEFVKEKGLLEEFKEWKETTGRELAETFFREGLEMLKEIQALKETTENV